VIFDESGNGRHAVYKKTILCDQFELDVRPPTTLRSLLYDQQRLTGSSTWLGRSHWAWSDQIRDIRRIDPTKLNRIPTVVIKNDAIILTVLHIRAIIKHNAVILFDPAGMTETTLQKAMIGHLKVSQHSFFIFLRGKQADECFVWYVRCRPH
jgi:hypothetical protein